MARTSSFGDRRSKLSFDRIEESDSGFSDRTLEIPAEIDLAAKGFQSVTWVYDTVNDTVIWSMPLEEFFGFPEGASGFTVLRDRPDPGTAQDPVEGLAEPEPWSSEPVRFASSSDLEATLLAPILAPIRAGAPLADVDLRMAVDGPDGTEHHLVVRASFMSRVEPALDRADTFYAGVVVDITAQRRFEKELSEMVDRYRLLTEVSPDVVFVHQNGLLVYGNRAAARLMGAGSTEEDYRQTVAAHYGQPVTDFMHPADIPDLVERLAQLTEHGQFFEHGEVRSVTPSGQVVVHGDHQHPHHLGW